MSIKNILILCICFLSGKSIYSQNIPVQVRNSELQFAVTGNYVTSATIQLNPFLNDPLEQYFSQDLKGGYGFGFSVKKKFFWDNFYVGLSTEYIKITDDGLSQYIYNNDTNYLNVRVTESVWMVPVELSAIFDLPPITENLKIFLGGGFGLYFGDRKRKMILFETETINRYPKFNLQVLCGMEYRLAKNVSGIFQVCFRQAQFNIHSKFPADRFTYLGYDYYFVQEYNSKIYFDGLKLSLGLGYNF